jgi:large subunit ribosomal protein L3
MGNVNRTIQNLEVVGIRAEDNVILVRGGVPGATGALIEIRKAIKSYQSKSSQATKAA